MADSVPLHRLQQGDPGQQRAFDAYRELAHAGQNLQVAGIQIVGQLDVLPKLGAAPTSSWVPGEIVEELQQGVGVDRAPPFSSRLALAGVAVLLAAYGTWTALRMPIDVLPDLNRPVVTVMTEAHGMVPKDVERLVTWPIEQVLNGTYKQSTCPELWDGNAASRIATELLERYGT